MGTQIKQWRINLGLSQAELCRRAGVGPDALSRLEAGKMANPAWLMVEKLFRGMGAQIEVKVHPGLFSSTPRPQQPPLPMPTSATHTRPDNRLHADG